MSYIQSYTRQQISWDRLDSRNPTQSDSLLIQRTQLVEHSATQQVTLSPVSDNHSDRGGTLERRPWLQFSLLSVSGPPSSDSVLGCNQPSAMPTPTCLSPQHSTGSDVQWRFPYLGQIILHLRQQKFVFSSKNTSRPWNQQSPVSETDGISIRPQGRTGEVVSFEFIIPSQIELFYPIEWNTFKNERSNLDKMFFLSPQPTDPP